MSLGPFNHQALVDINAIEADHYSEDSYSMEEIEEFIQQDVPEYGPNHRRLPVARNSLYMQTCRARTSGILKY